MERLKLFREIIDFTQTEMAGLLGIKQNAYSQIENEKVSFTDRNRQVLCSMFGINPHWFSGDPVFRGRDTILSRLITDENGILNYEDATKADIRMAAIKTMGWYSEDEIVQKVRDLREGRYKPGGGGGLSIGVSEPAPEYNPSRSSRPHFEATFACGAPGGFSEALKSYEGQGMRIPDLPDYDFSVAAAGESMINESDRMRSIYPGDYIAIKKKSGDTPRWGEVYAMATIDGFTVKKVMPSEKEGHVLCVSFNPAFPPFDQALSEIYEWGVVVGIARVYKW